MENKFDTANYPDRVPEELVAGTRWAWTRSDITSVYPVDTYTLKYRFSLQESPYSDFELSADKVTGCHCIEVSQGDSSDFVPGEYIWQAIIIRDADSEEVDVDTGFLTILPDMGNAPGDTRSWIYQVLVAIRENVKARAASGQAGHDINGKSITWRSYDELLKLEKEFARRWANERADIERRAGRSTNSRVLVKMSA